MFTGRWNWGYTFSCFLSLSFFRLVRGDKTNGTLQWGPQSGCILWVTRTRVLFVSDVMSFFIISLLSPVICFLMPFTFHAGGCKTVEALLWRPRVYVCVGVSGWVREGSSCWVCAKYVTLAGQVRAASGGKRSNPHLSTSSGNEASEVISLIWWNLFMYRATNSSSGMHGVWHEHEISLVKNILVIAPRYPKRGGCSPSLAEA